MPIPLLAALLAAASPTAAAAPPAGHATDPGAHAGPAHITTFDIGHSRHGRPILVHRIGSVDGDALPAVLVVAGADGRYRSGRAVARGIIDALAASPEHLHGAVVYVLPDLNPDHTAWQDDPATPRADWGRTIAPYDADRDGRIDEDGGDDVNGDGMITMMRVRDPHPQYNLAVEWIIDADDPRIMRRADAAKGEVPTHAMLIESIDRDGDGRFAEDGIAGEAGGGIDLNMNFPALWPEFADGAGQIPLSEPESLAFVDWMLERDNIMAVVVYGPHDTLVQVPATGRFDATGRVPLGIEEGDRALYERISARYKEITGRTTADSPSDAGSLPRWTYAHLGLPTFATALWSGDTPPEAAAEPASESDPAPESTPDVARPRGRGGAAAGGRPRQSSAPQRGDDARWLAISDARDGEGFVEWSPFDHPQLGNVEIGGFVPGFRVNPPDDLLPDLIEQQTRFISSILAELPVLVAEDHVAQRVAPNLWRVGVRVRNEGVMPTSSAMLDKARRHAPLIAAIEVPPASIVSGTRLVRLPSLRGGAHADAEWLIRANDGASVTVTIRSRIHGDRTVTIELTETRP